MLGNPIFVHACWLTMILFAMNSSNSTLQTQNQAVPPNDSKTVHITDAAPDKITPEPPIDTPKRNNHFQLDTSTNQAESRAVTSASSTENMMQQQKLKLQQLVADSKLHYIGVYESSAQEYSNEEQRSRKAECESSQSSHDCWEYAYRAKKEVDNTVTVHINSQNNVSLILSSYDSVKWIITGNTQRVKFIYLTGYHASDVSIPSISSKKLYASFYDSSACSYCLSSNLEYFYGYQLDGKINNKVADYFGKPIDLFQGQYKAKQFYVN